DDRALQRAARRLATVGNVLIQGLAPDSRGRRGAPAEQNERRPEPPPRGAPWTRPGQGSSPRTSSKRCGTSSAATASPIPNTAGPSSSWPPPAGRGNCPCCAT